MTAGGVPAGPEALSAELRQSLPSWLISLVGHLLILAALWPIQLATSMIRDSIVSVTAGDDEEPVAAMAQESIRFDTAAMDEVGNGGDSTAEAGQRVASLGSAIQTPKAPDLNVQGTITVAGTGQIAIKRPMLDVGATTSDRELSDVVETTGTSEHAGGVRGAIDRLTLEIEASLKQDNTLLVWLFDATPSMADRREEIALRFGNVYRQLGLLGVGGNGALKTVVATFGKSTNYLTRKPIDDVSSIQKAIHNIKDDDDDSKKGAVENVFSATLSAAEKFRSFRTAKKKTDRRRVMIVIVTDEHGSDMDRVEEAIVRLRKLGIRVYCVGDDAVFGRERHYFPHVFPDGFHGLGYTNRGPETAMLEGLQLTFWGRRDRFQEITSGFGPYALCRLCAETGGLFLISEELGGPRFDENILRNYLPDYRPLREYQAELSRNAAKAGLVRAAMAAAAESIPRPRDQFRADNDNTLRKEITEAQKPIAELDYRLGEMYEPLDAGAKDRSGLDTPRWKASYDLAMGRLCAMRARTMGYNRMLAEMKSLPRPFQNAGDNTWRIVPSSAEHETPPIQKLAKRAHEYLEGVIQEHRGTPWELLAREELETPMGWDWMELHVNYPPPHPPRAPKNNLQLEEERREMMRQQQQQVSHDPVKL